MMLRARMHEGPVFVRICTGIFSSFYLLGHVRVSLSYIVFVALIPRYCAACLHQKICTIDACTCSLQRAAVGTIAENGKRLRFISRRFFVYNSPNGLKKNETRHSDPLVFCRCRLTRINIIMSTQADVLPSSPSSAIHIAAWSTVSTPAVVGVRVHWVVSGLAGTAARSTATIWPSPPCGAVASEPLAAPAPGFHRLLHPPLLQFLRPLPLGRFGGLAGFALGLLLLSGPYPSHVALEGLHTLRVGCLSVRPSGLEFLVPWVENISLEHVKNNDH